jgi:hypothetical protein
MPLPEKMPESLLSTLTVDHLFSEVIAQEIVKQLENDKPVTWNFLLNKQLELEKGDRDETHA